MAFVIHSDESHKFYYQLETTFGTAIGLDQATFKALEFEKGQFFDLGITKTNLNQNRASRVLSLVDLFHDNFSGPVGFTGTTYLSKDRVADMLYLVTQNRVSQGAVGTGYQKVFRLHASQPDFTANAGAFATMIWKSPESGGDARFTSGILKELNLTFDKSGSGESSLVKATMTWIFKKYEIDQTFSGSGAARDITLAYRAHAFDMDLTFVGAGISSAVWDKFSLTINNGASGLSKDANGNPVTYFLNPGEAGLKASAEVWYTGAYLEALTDFSAGNTVTISVETGSNNTDGHLLIVGKGTITNTPLAAANGQLRIPIEMMLGNTTAAGTDACDITVADGISQA